MLYYVDMKPIPATSGNLFSNINSVIRLLIISDVLLVSGAGLLGPIFALFIEDFIVGGGPIVAGVAATIYLLTKSVLQLPVSMLIDKLPGERDDFTLLLIGSLGLALIPLAYFFINTPLQLYVLQFIQGIMAAFAFPAYMAIFTRHIDKNKEGLEWGVYFTTVDLASAATAAIGGVVASSIGFEWVITGVLMLKLIGAGMLLPIKLWITA